jgi:hypothetical protein
LPRPAACTAIAPAGRFVDAAGSDLADMTESVCFTAAEFEIPTPPNTSIAKTVKTEILWETMKLNSKRNFA